MSREEATVEAQGRLEDTAEFQAKDDGAMNLDNGS